MHRDKLAGFDAAISRLREVWPGSIDLHASEHKGPTEFEVQVDPGTLALLNETSSAIAELMTFVFADDGSDQSLKLIGEGFAHTALEFSLVRDRLETVVSVLHSTAGRQRDPVIDGARATLMSNLNVVLLNFSQWARSPGESNTVVRTVLHEVQTRANVMMQIGYAHSDTAALAVVCEYALVRLLEMPTNYLTAVLQRYVDFFTRCIKVAQRDTIRGPLVLATGRLGLLQGMAGVNVARPFAEKIGERVFSRAAAVGEAKSCTFDVVRTYSGTLESGFSIAADGGYRNPHNCIYREPNDCWHCDSLSVSFIASNKGGFPQEVHVGTWLTWSELTQASSDYVRYLGMREVFTIQLKRCERYLLDTERRAA
jgi:hypothetical protein